MFIFPFSAQVKQSALTTGKCIIEDVFLRVICFIIYYWLKPQLIKHLSVLTPREAHV